MMALQVRAERDVRAVCPHITGISFDGSTPMSWRINFTASATEQQKIAARNALESINLNESLFRLSDIQYLHDLMPSHGGVIELPAGVIDGKNGEEVVITKPVKIIGKGMNMSDSQNSAALTQINYSGNGVAVQIGRSDQANPLYGVELRNFGIKCTGSGTAGILLEGNTNLGTLTSRCLIEDVDARGFVTGCGIDLHYGIGITLRRVHAHNNGSGIRVRWGNVYEFDGVICRHNLYGIRADAFNALHIGGGSVLESNNGPGLFVCLEDHCSNLSLEKTWLENNNVQVTSTDNQMHVVASDLVPLAKLTLLEMSKLNFNGSRGGDLFLSSAVHVTQSRIKWSNGTFTP